MEQRSNPLISLIAAMAENRVIGVDNRLPWHLPADLQHFKHLTMGKPMVMGRRTWESLPGLLPGRKHIVLTRQQDFTAAGAERAIDPDDAIRIAAPAAEVMVVGGAQVYQQFMTIADRIYLTLVHCCPEGDAFFPEIDLSYFQLAEQRDFAADSRNPLSFSLLRYERIHRCDS